nr:uncharacterized protein LOC123752540 [Procambarus clarkii]
MGYLKEAWMVLLIGAGALGSKVPVGFVSECVSQYWTPDHQTYSAVSEIICAFHCYNKKALEYTYDGEGLGSSSQAVTYVESLLNETLEEIAYSKTTYTCATWDWKVGSFAVDGRLDVDSMSENADTILYPWWVVDLGQARLISYLNIYTRQNCCSERFHDIEIRVGATLEASGNFSSYTLFSTYKGPYSTTLGSLYCFRKDGVVGRFISIQRVTPELADHLQLIEVFVWAKMK